MNSLSMPHSYIDGSFFSSVRLSFFVFFIFFILVFSFSFHALWILYDVVALSALAYYVRNNKISLKAFQWLMLNVTIFYFILMSLFGSHFFVGLLSTWDTFKHILMFILLQRTWKCLMGSHREHFMGRLYRCIFFAIVMQFVFVSIQLRNNAALDHVVGSFGAGLTHAMSYLTILFIIITIVLKSSKLLVILSILISVWLNVMVENVGFFVLLPLLLIGVLINKRVGIRAMLLGAACVPVVMLLLSQRVYFQQDYRSIIMSRVATYASGAYDLTKPGRGASLIVSIQRGGWFGNGPGSFSNIYLMKGYDYDPADDPTQINIAESSHLIFESGVVGLALTLMTYYSFLWRLFRKKRNKLFVIIIFTACMFYSSLLMTEPQIFLLLLGLILFKECELDPMLFSKSSSEYG